MSSVVSKKGAVKGSSAPAAGYTEAVGRSIVATAAARAFGKAADRDVLPAGLNARVGLQMAATIDGEPAGEYTVACQLGVGHNSERAGAGPKKDWLVDYLLSKMNAATAEASLRDLPTAWAASNGDPVGSPEMRKRAKAALKAAGATETVTKRGDVSCRATIAAVK